MADTQSQIEEDRQNYLERSRIWRRTHYQENREKESEKSKIYYDDNREELLKKDKIYRDNNKELMSERGKIKYEKNKDKTSKQIICVCGGTHTKHHQSRHLKTKKHMDFVENL
jgi:hypothetical protein